MGERREGHTDLAPLVVIGAPVASWVFALAVLHGGGSGLVYAVLFLVVPFAINLVVLSLVGARAAAIPAAIFSSVIGGASWIVVGVLFAAKFAN
jgi:hypothetical protein